MAALSKVRSSGLEVEVYARLLHHLRTYRRLEVLGFEATAANIAEQFRKERLRIGAMDLKIAAIVLAHRATLITRNIVDFRKIRGLIFEDWSSEP